jgi:hypothetical protein
VASAGGGEAAAEGKRVRGCWLGSCVEKEDKGGIGLVRFLLAGGLLIWYGLADGPNRHMYGYLFFFLNSFLIYFQKNINKKGLWGSTPGMTDFA